MPPVFVQWPVSWGKLAYECFPYKCFYGWWEADGIYLGIRLLEKLGLAWKLRKPGVAPEN